MLCSICFNEIPVVNGWAEGNNADPVNPGRCCHDCDAQVVIPARIRLMTGGAYAAREYDRIQREALVALQRHYSEPPAEPAAS